MRSFCRIEGNPALSTVTRWIVGKPEFWVQYASAREAAGFAHADSVLEVVEELRLQGIDAQTARAMMDGLKWAAERMASKHHSASQKVDHTSSDGSMTPKDHSDAVLAALKAKHDTNADSE